MQTVQAAVASLMSGPVLTIGQDAVVSEVLALAKSQGVHHFPIVTEGRLVGIVCTCDLEDLSPTDRVMRRAWRHVITLPPDADLADAARLMVMQGVGSIVVTDAASIRGILTREDLIRADSALEQHLADAQCSACGARKHLRPGPAGQCLCQDCHSRAKQDGAFDAGYGD